MSTQATVTMEDRARTAEPDSAGVPPSERAGHRDEFEDFYRREYPAMVALAYALCGHGGAAEDVVQEAFLVAHRRWAQIRSYDRPGAFLRRVVANLAVSQHRRRAAEGRALVRLAGRRPDPFVDPEGNEPDPAFWRAVRALPHRQAQALALCYLEDHSTEDIAAILGCAEATVRVHLHRGRQALAVTLNERSAP